MTSPEKVTDIIPQAQAIARIVETTMAAHGAQVNFTAGKAEAMINARGEGAPAFRRHMWFDLQNKIWTAVGEKQVCLRVVEKYKHLASQAHFKMCKTPKARYRCATTTSPLRAL